jgi:hypothetical protein
MRVSLLERLCFFVASYGAAHPLAAHLHISYETDMRHQVEKMTSKSKIRSASARLADVKFVESFRPPSLAQPDELQAAAQTNY